MTTIRKTLTITEQQDSWIKSQIEVGDFTNESEYIRHLIRLDQEQKNKIQELKKAIQEGVDSGVSKKTFSDIMKDVESSIRKNGKL
jgi:antitoxin ParD1/3/4